MQKYIKQSLNQNMRAVLYINATGEIYLCLALKKRGGKLYVR